MVNIRNRVQVSKRRLQLKWSDTPTEVIIAIVTAFALMAMLATLAGCEDMSPKPCEVRLTVGGEDGTMYIGTGYDIDPTRGSSTICYTVYKGTMQRDHETICTYEEVRIEKVCP